MPVKIKCIDFNSNHKLVVAVLWCNASNGAMLAVITILTNITLQNCGCLRVQTDNALQSSESLI